MLSYGCPEYIDEAPRPYKSWTGHN